MQKILIVEDDIYVRRLYEEVFRRYRIDAQIEMAGDGQEALEKVSSFRPELILLDIMMPRMDGLSVLKKLKSDPATSHIIIVMLTVLGDQGTYAEATKLGADGFIVKSEVEPAKLVEVIEGYAATAKQKQNS